MALFFKPKCTQYENIRPQYSYDNTIHVNNILIQVLNYIKILLIKLIHKIFPQYKDKLGRDIDQLSFKNLELLKGYDRLAKDHIDQFQKKIENLWNPLYPELALEIFKDNLKKSHSVICTSFGTLYSMVVTDPIPGITKEDKQVMTILYYKYVLNIEDKQLHEVELDELTLRDIKVYYNLCVKCMNYATQLEGLIPPDLLCNAFEVFNNCSKFSPLHLVDEEKLRNNQDFVALLQELKPHIKVNLHNIPYSCLINQEESIVIKLLIENFINGNSFHITYGDIEGLILVADSIHRSLEKSKLQQPLERDIGILEIGKELGLIDADSVNEIHNIMHEYSESLLADKKKALEEVIENLLLENNIKEIRSIVEKLPNIVHCATRSIEVSLPELFANFHYTAI